MTPTPRLTWLFEAIFEDGHIVRQTPEDLSEFDPSRSAFYDVMEYAAHGGKLVTFGLVRGDVIYAVDLLDGHFEIQFAQQGGENLRFPFRAEPLTVLRERVGDVDVSHALPPGGTYELAYFRDRVERLHVGSDGRTLAHDSEISGYRLGWEYRTKDATWRQSILVK